MKKASIVWLIVAALLILIGCMIFVGGMTMFKWDFFKLETDKYETNTYEVNENFNNISIKANTEDITFKVSEDGKCKVVCFENKKEKHTVLVENDTLTVNVENNRKWYDYIQIGFKSPKITVYLPNTEYKSLFIKEDTGDIEIPKDFEFESIDLTLSTGHVKNYASATQSIKIKTSTGKIHVENVNTGSLDLSVSTGDITVYSISCQAELKIKVSTGDADLKDVSCESLSTTGSTGSLKLSSVIASKKFDIKRSTGGIKLEKCDASEICIKTSTGSVKGTLLTEKIFITKSDTGSIKVPSSTSGGKCEITTDTGDIKIQIEE